MAVLGFVVGLGLLWGYAGWLYLASRDRNDNAPSDREPKE
jgi:hypothetical protein